jgi:hypothetical protein
MGLKPINNYAFSPGVTLEALHVFNFRITYTARFESIFSFNVLYQLNVLEIQGEHKVFP